MPTLSINPIFHWAVVTVIGVVLVGLLLLGPAAARISGRRKALLVALRTVVIIATIIAMLRPTLVYRSTEEQTATLTVLIDTSRSMGVESTDGTRTRYERLKEELSESLDEFVSLGESLNVKFYAFGLDANELPRDGNDLQFPEQPDADQTAIGYSISEVRRQNAGERIVGVVLLTDGNQKAVVPRDRPVLAEVREMAAAGIGLYAVQFGAAASQEGLPDVSIEDLAAPERIYEKNEMIVTARARISGYQNQPLQAELLMESGSGEMEVVASQSIRALSGTQVIDLELAHIPRLPGERKVQVRVRDQPGELVTVNNEQSTFVTVDSGGVSVIYLEGKPRFEMGKIRRAIDQSANIQLDLLKLDAEAFGTDGSRRPDSVTADLAEAFTPGRHDVFILGDVDSRAFRADELDQLAECVREAGAGLIMIGGAHSFSGGGYADTVLADVLPVGMDRLGQQNYGEQIRADGHHPGPNVVFPSELEANHYTTRLASPRAANDELWRNLPPLDGLNKVTVNPTSRVLLQTERRIPVLVSGEYGGGRVLAFMGDSTWKNWQLIGNAEQEHKRFWRQLTLWLARKDTAGDGSVRISLASRRVRQNGRAEITLQAVTADEEPIPDADWQAEIVLPDESRIPLNLNRRGSEMVATFVDTHLAGDFRVEASATKGPTDLGAARSRFLVFEQDLEMERPVADSAALEAWTSAADSGAVFTPDNFDLLLDELRKLPQQLSRQTYVKVSLWDRWPMFTLIACLMTLEWFLRKKWGLV